MLYLPKQKCWLTLLNTLILIFNIIGQFRIEIGVNLVSIWKSISNWLWTLLKLAKTALNPDTPQFEVGPFSHRCNSYSNAGHSSGADQRGRHDRIQGDTGWHCTTTMYARIAAWVSISSLFSHSSIFIVLSNSIVVRRP